MSILKPLAKRGKGRKPKGKIDPEEARKIGGKVMAVAERIIALAAPPVTPGEVLAVIAAAQELVGEIQEALLD